MTVGAVLVIGGGIAGIRASLDLADAGFKVYLVEAAPSIGGGMAQLDKTFPTLDCSICIEGPWMTDIARHQNIELLSYSEVVGLEGTAGDFITTVRRKARGVDEEACTGCGACFDVCPIKVPHEFDAGLSTRGAIYRVFAQAVPNCAVIDKEHCVNCGLCVLACEREAINLEDRDEEIHIKVGAVIVATGFTLFDPTPLGEYGFGVLPDVVTNMQLERLVCASGPTQGHVIRPSTGELAKSIAFIQCVGARDTRYQIPCSKVCCTAATKEAILAKEHFSEVEPYVFYTDLRGYGKGFSVFMEDAARGHGVHFIRGRVGQISQMPNNGQLVVRYEDTFQGQPGELAIDLAVLACAMAPSVSNKELSNALGIQLNEFGFFKETSPLVSTRPGIFVAGCAQSPKDVCDSVAQGSGAAGKAAALLGDSRHSLTVKKERPPEKEIGPEPRIGVWVCQCGANINGVVDVPAVADYAATLPNVVHAASPMYACSKDMQAEIEHQIREEDLNRVVVASCTPRTHEPLFRDTCAEAGLNPYLFEMANIREHVSWVHVQEPEKATQKAKDIVRAGIARARLLRPQRGHRVEIHQSALVVGGGVAGLTAALAIADQGFQVHLIERENALGGSLRNYNTVLPTYSPASEILEPLIEKVKEHPDITVYERTTLSSLSGFAGNFNATLATTSSAVTEKGILVGAVVIASGSQEFKPTGAYGYGSNPKVITQMELEEKLQNNDFAFSNVVMIQCVHSFDDDHPYCSRSCCINAVKNAIELKKRKPYAEVYILHRDLMTFGLYEKDYLDSRTNHGVHYIRYDPANPPRVEEKDGRQYVYIKNALSQSDNELQLEADYVVLSPPEVPDIEMEKLQNLLGVPRSDDGFFMEAHPKLRPLDFVKNGVFLAGGCQSPKEVEYAIAQAAGAAARAGALLAKDYLETEAITSHVNEELCIGCGRCLSICTFDAIEFVKHPVSGEFKARTNEALCKGCGLCGSVCPNDAITLRHFEREQIECMIDAFLEEA
jgi:heterodisulfide reductase subunit A